MTFSFCILTQTVSVSVTPAELEELTDIGKKNLKEHFHNLVEDMKNLIHRDGEKEVSV